MTVPNFPDIIVPDSIARSGELPTSLQTSEIRIESASQQEYSPRHLHKIILVVIILAAAICAAIAAGYIYSTMRPAEGSEKPVALLAACGKMQESSNLTIEQGCADTGSAGGHASTVSASYIYNFPQTYLQAIEQAREAALFTKYSDIKTLRQTQLQANAGDGVGVVFELQAVGEGTDAGSRTYSGFKATYYAY